MSNKGKETKVVTNLDNHTDEMMERFKYRNCGSCQFFCIYFFKTVDGEQGCVVANASMIRTIRLSLAGWM